MAFFSEAFFANSPTSTPPIQTDVAHEADIDINQSLDEATDFLSSSDIDRLLSSSPRTRTPRLQRLFDTPPSSVTNRASSSDAKPKRVDFAPFTQDRIGWAANAGPNAQKENFSAALLRKLQPSKERNTLRSKSILKATRSGGNEQSSSPEMQPVVRSWTQVLDFGSKQLRSDKPGMRLDAWRSMQQFLAASSDIQALEDGGAQHNSILSYAVRDLQYTEKEQENGVPNQLPNFTLKFLSKFVQLPGELSSATLSNLLDVATDQLQSRELSKNLVRCYMEFFYHQNFSTEVMTALRMRRIVEAMQALQLHESSSGTLMDEMKVCRKFVDQCPEGMIGSAASWLSIFMHGVLSEDGVTFKFTADALFDIAVKLGHRPEVSKALQKALHTTDSTDDNQTLLQRLEKDMVTKADFARDVTQATAVPKLLSAIFMLSRARGPLAVFGAQFRSFVTIIKPYFNKSAFVSHAYTAWSWLVIAQTHGGRWPEDQAVFLRRPIENILMQSTMELELEKATPAHALSVYLVILYCSFAPDARQLNMKEKWETCISQVLQAMVQTKSKAHTNVAADIFCALLSSSTPWDTELLVQGRKPWNSTMLEIHDLARVDPLWIRANVGAATRVLDRFLKSAQRAEHAVATFKAVLDAVAQASANEIVTTKEAKIAVAEITNYLTHIWKPYSRKAKDIVLFDQLLEQLLDQSRPNHAIFGEKILRKTSENDQVEVATTPSHRSSNSQQPVSATSHFLMLLTQELVQQYPRNELSQDQDEPSVLFDAIKRLNPRLYLSEPTLAGKIKVLCNTVRRLIQMKKNSEQLTGRVYVDQLCLEGLVQLNGLVESQETASESMESACPQLAALFSDVACYCSNVSLQLDLCYRSVMTRATSASGPATAMLQISESCARQIYQSLTDADVQLADDTLLNFSATLVETMPQGITSADLRKALEKIGGSRSLATAKKSDVLEVYHMSDLVLTRAYAALVNGKQMVDSGLARFIAALMNLLLKQKSDALSQRLKIMQSGMAVLVQDKQGAIFKQEVNADLTGSISKLWAMITDKILFSSVKQGVLNEFDELVAAGLSSRASRIVNATVAAWNRVYGIEGSVIIPARTAKAIRKLQAIDVDILVASELPPADENAPDSPLVVESTESTVDLEETSFLPTPKPQKIVLRLTVSPAPPSASRRRPISVTPKSKPKPRHEDSQIHFEPIASSPLPQPDPEVLTERQKEVAERQREGSAARFAETSTPVIARSHNTEPEKEADYSVETPTTPVLAAALDDTVASSSPVVASVRRRESSVRRSILPDISVSAAPPVTGTDDVPSSPPAGPTENQNVEDEIPPLTLDRNEILRRKQLSRASQLSPAVHQPREPTDQHGAAEEVDANATDLKQLTVAAATQPEGESFNSLLSIPVTMTESSDSRVEDSFVGPNEDAPLPSTENGDDLEDDLGASQQSLGNSQATESQKKKKRKRGRTSFASQKRRKTQDAHVYDTENFIKFTPRPRFVTPDDMLPMIVVAIPNDEEAIEPIAQVEEDIQVPATTVKRSRGRPRRSIGTSSSQVLQESSPARKRRRSISRVDELEADVPRSSKRTRAMPKTPAARERSLSSVHYIEVTPGDAAGRRGAGSTRTDTPEADEMISFSQQLDAEDQKMEDTVIASTYEEADSAPAAAQPLDAVEADAPAVPEALITSQIEETQEGHQSDGDDFHSMRDGSPATSCPPSQADSQESQDSQSSQVSNFSVSAFRGVMSRFVDQIKEFVNGGRRVATEEAARQMADEANKTVERLARAANRRRSG